MKTPSHALEIQSSSTIGNDWLLYIGVLLFLCLRTPYEFIHGYIYDEEGTVYLRYAWDSRVWRALIAPHQGYYSLFANVCGIIAVRVVSLEHAGHFLFFAEIAVEMLLVFMVMQCEALDSAVQKYLAVGIVLLTPPTADIALSTIHAQFFLAVITCVILISDAERLRTIRLVTLGCAGLTGVTSCVMLPFFLLQAWKERTSGRIAQAGALLICCLVQAAVLLSQPEILHGPHSTFQFYFGAILSNGVLAHFFTRWSYVESCRALGSPKLRNLQELWWSSVEFASAIYIALVVFLSWKGGRATRLLTSAAIVSLAIGFKRSGALNEDLMCGSGGRYFFVFNVLIGLGLVLISRNASRMYSVIGQVLVVCSLVSGLIDVKYIATRQHLPTWAQEVASWRSDPDYRLRIRPNYWPGVKLTREFGNKDLPFDIYDTTLPGWRNR
jgi:hypothetical protein